MIINHPVKKPNKPYIFLIGSSPGVTKHASLFNIMSHFNRKLRAGSTVSSEAVETIKEGNGLNFATFGATIEDAEFQADKLIEAIKEKEMPVNWDSSWKLITVDFGLDSLFLDYEGMIFIYTHSNTIISVLFSFAIKAFYALPKSSTKT